MPLTPQPGAAAYPHPPLLPLLHPKQAQHHPRPLLEQTAGGCHQPYPLQQLERFQLASS
jgi:hypothetical protein